VKAAAGALLLLAVPLGACGRAPARDDGSGPVAATSSDPRDGALDVGSGAGSSAGASRTSTAAALAATLLPLAVREAGAGAGGAAGSITGVARWDGSTPLKIKQLTNATDAATCGERVSPGSVVAGPAGELANVVIELRRPNDSRRGSSKPLAAPGDVVSVGIERCLQQPHVLVVPLGADVEIENRDGILHELVGLSVRNAPFDASLPRYRRRARVESASLSRPERIRVACEAHPWAVSWWVVTGAEHHAITGRDGAFTLAGVPVGTWRLIAWHEELGEIERTVDVGSAGPARVELAWR
jgi:hypothetical protein